MAVKSTLADHERLTTVADRELNLPPETEVSDSELKERRYKDAKSLLKFKEEIQEIRTALPGTTRLEAIEIINKRDRNEIEKNVKSKKKKKKDNSMKSGGKVYSRGSRKANYNG